MSAAPKIAPPTTCQGSRRTTAMMMSTGRAATLASNATPCVTLFAISSPSDSGRSCIGLRGLRANVVQGALHVDAHHLLPPGEREVGVVHRFRGTVRGIGRRADRAFI